MTTTKPVYIVDLIGTVVQAVIAEVLAQIQANETAALGTTGIRVAKYPMIYVVQDFVEHRGKLAGVYADINLQVIVCHQTDGDYKITDRYTNVFKPVLYPIYYSFMKQLALSNMTFPSSPDLISHDKYDRSFWGTSKVVGSGGTDRSVLNDFVDAIDIQNLQLKIDYQPC